MKNSRSALAILLFLCSIAGMAQVGIGTTTPAATLDITATNLAGATVDGLLVPRVSRLRAQTMTGTPTSTVLYVNDVSVGTLAGTTVNVTTVGFYFFNGTVWEKLGSGATNAWNVTGNSGLSGTTNFLGTTDGVDVAFRRNDVPSGKIGATSTSFGVNALNAGIGTNNAAFGTNALILATGIDNVAVGNGVLSAVTTGVQNTGVGNAALAVNTGSASTAVGFEALKANTSGSNSTAFGFRALTKNTTATNNTGVGFEALTNNTTGSGNVAMGFQASGLNSTGYQNTGLGYQAAYQNSTGFYNTAVGYQPLYFNTTGANNTAIGKHALHQNTASNNTAVGHQALLNNNSSTGNTAVGADALRINTGASAFNNTALGFFAGAEHSAGTNNTYVGFESGKYSAGAATTNNNTFLGAQSGLYSSGSSNTALGANTLMANIATANNVAVGYNALTANQGTGNVALGYSAGSAETGSNKLYITNSATTATTSLIYGEFSPTKILRTNSIFQIGDPSGTGYVFPAARGTVNQVLQTNASGVLTWVNPSALSVTETDPQVSSVSTNAVPRWNATTLVDGVITDNGTNVGIGGAPTVGNKLDVTGNTKTTNFQMTSGATNGYILQSDAAGNATWVQNPINALSLVRANLTANQALTTAGWQKINFNSEAFDTSSEFDIGTGRFTATKAGYYRVNASFHTNNQSNTNLYSIGIYVNGSLYQLTSVDHSGSGNVERSATCLVQLAVGGYIEVFAENFVTGVDIDSYSGKTAIEIQQVR
jgi:hypothetical protein